VHVSYDTESTKGHCLHDDSEHEQKDTGPLKVLSGVLLIGGAVVILHCLILIPAIFGTAGIVGGSVAAATQSASGNVVAGSAFDVAQAAEALGTLVASTIAGAAGAVAAAKVEPRQNEEPKQHGENCNNNSDTDANKW
jgi:hypothetical protein